MPYVERALSGQKAQKTAAQSGPTDPDMPQIAPHVEKLELICSSFSDPGPDWCEWLAYSADGQIIGRRFVNGY